MAGKGGKRSTSFKPGQCGNPDGRPSLTSPARKILADIKLLAKDAGESAIKTLVSVMEDAQAPPAARVGAATAILDRGYGKPTQPIVAQVSIFDTLTDDEQRALIAAISALERFKTVETRRLLSC